MQPLETKIQTVSLYKKKLRNFLWQKSHVTSWDKKNHATSLDKKITQPPETKLCNLSEQKKSRNLWGGKMHYFGTKKITQPLGTKTIMQQKEIKQPLAMQCLGTIENNATSLKKKSHNLSGWKIMQQFWDKKSQNVLGLKNHATSWNNKITQHLG